MSKRFMLSIAFLLLTGVCYAQSAAEDSLRLKKLGKNGEDLKLNEEVVKRIKFDSKAKNPRMSEEKKWMRFDDTLPDIIPPATVTDSCYSDSIRTLEIKMVIQLPPLKGISLGHGVWLDGGLISGLDMLQIFTKDFWQFRKKQMRKHTLEVLGDY